MALFYKHKGDGHLVRAEAAPDSLGILCEKAGNEHFQLEPKKFSAEYELCDPQPEFLTGAPVVAEAKVEATEKPPEVKTERETKKGS
jgi:hypothetical protein